MGKPINNDGGHCAQSPGASGFVDETTLTHNIAPRVNNILRSWGCDSVLLSDGYDNLSDLNVPVNEANRRGGLYVSYHLDASDNPQANGHTIYVYPGNYNGETQWLADNIRAALNEAMGDEIYDRGIRQADFHVLRETNHPAVLIEFCFVTNQSDANWIANDQNTERLCVCLAKRLAFAGGYNVDGLSTPFPSPQPEERPSVVNMPVSEDIDILYQVHTPAHGWLPEVRDLEDYAGLQGFRIDGLYMRSTKGRVRYRVHTLQFGWLPWVIDHEDYAGLYGQNIDCIQCELLDVPGKQINYRVSPIGGRYFSAINGYSDDPDNGLAGLYGLSIDRLQAWVD